MIPPSQNHVCPKQTTSATIFPLNSAPHCRRSNSTLTPSSFSTICSLHPGKQTLPRILRIQLRQLPQNFFTPLILHLRHDNLHLNNLVPPSPFPRSRRNTLLPQSKFLPRLRPRRNLQLRSPPTIMRIDRRHVDLRAQRGLRHRNRNGYIDIIPGPGKHRMRPRLDNQKQIPRRPATSPGIALPRQPNPLPIPSPRLDPKLQRLFLNHNSFAIAGRAGVLHLPRPTTPRALDIELHPPAHLRPLPRPMTLRALHTSTRCRFALARRTDLLPLNLQPRHPAPHRGPEVNAHLILKIGPRLSPARRVPPSAEHTAKNVLEAAAKAATRLLLRTPPALKIRKIEPAKIKWDLLAAMARSPAAITPPSATATRIPAPRRRLRSRRIDVVRIETKLIVDLSLLVVAQNIVRLGDLLELFLGLFVIRIHVRVVLPRSLAKRLANLIRRRRLLHTQRAVIVFRLCRHSLLPFCNSADFRTSKTLLNLRIGSRLTNRTPEQIPPRHHLRQNLRPAHKTRPSLPPIYIVSLFLQHRSLLMWSILRLRRHNPPIHHPRLHQRARLLPYRPQRALLYLTARRKGIQPRPKQQLRTKDIPHTRRHLLIHQQLPDRLLTLRNPSNHLLRPISIQRIGPKPRQQLLPHLLRKHRAVHRPAQLYPRHLLRREI